MNDPRLLLVALLVAIGAVAFLSMRLARVTRAARANQGAADRERERHAAMRARSERAVAGESDAALLLRAAGYDVLDRQVGGAWSVRADGVPLSFDLRADYLVARGDRRYVAEVKTGRVATRLSHGPTRRQLLEYAAAFDVAGVLLVDADARTITHVESEAFTRAPAPAPASSGALHAALWFAAGAVAGLVAASLASLR